MALALQMSFVLAQSNQYFWANGKFILGTQISPIDSVTFGEEETDSIVLFLPRTAIVHVRDTIIVHDTIYIATPCPDNPIVEPIDTNEVSAPISVTVAEAISIGKNQPQDTVTTDFYRVRGVVSTVITQKDKLTMYGNCNLRIMDPTGATVETIVCYYTNWLNDQPFTNADDIPAIGDTVVVVGKLTRYNGEAEIYQGYIEEIHRYMVLPIVADDDSGLNVPEGTITCAQALALGALLTDYTATDESYYIKGVILEMNTTQGSIEQFGTATFTMADAVDATEVFTAYCVYGLDSTALVDIRQVAPGNVVVIKSPIFKYQSIIETPASIGYIYSTTNTFVPEVFVPVIPEGPRQDIDFTTNPLEVSDYIEIESWATYTFGEVTLAIDKSSSKSKPRISLSDYRMYKNTSFTLSIPSDKNIKYILISAQSTYPATNLTASIGQFACPNMSTAIWTGSVNEVTFSNTGQVRITKITVVYE